MIKHFLALAALIAFIALAACNRESGPSQAGKSAPTDTTAKGDDHVHAPGEEHADDHSADATTPAGHGITIIELGTATIGDWAVRAARDQGEIKPGGDAPIDVWLNGGTAKVFAVRFWIGSEDAAGSIKAKADIENPAEPNHWHTHVEAPDPLPSNARLWVEIEDQRGQKTNASFDLKMKGSTP